MTGDNQNALASFVKSNGFTHFITGLIVFNAILIGLETFDAVYTPFKGLFFWIDFIILLIFLIEVVLKIIVDQKSYFMNGWNIFDFVIVVGSIILYSTPFVSVLRILRVLRIMRTITAVPSLRRIVTALFMAIPTISSVMLIMAIIFYVYAILGTSFYRDISPEFFGNLHLSFITLFQIFTLESWASGIFRPIFAEAPWSWLYFISFIVVATFIMINLIVGEIVNNAQKISEGIEGETDEIKEDTTEIKEDTSEIREIRRELAEIKELIKSQNMK
ncbi:ion transporter [Saliterribacillus persicus]|uniref:Voltage-gated sodium channel n=1 Tax=Saliterribacillus persicus TaxID=930114 RepID=A0A368XFP8_9BACI|nr:ion transporter [Saliterribacillus persicus]RCW65848.1 voltage-gated sodium channel [Saliterribacillus persicus]